MEQKRVLIDVGHGYYDKPAGKQSDYDSGAIASDGTEEFHLNCMTGIVVQQRLQLLGHHAAFVQQGLGLFERGAQAQGYDVFISIHHNASEKHNAQGSEAAVHRTLCTDVDKALAVMLSKHMAGALGIKDRGIVSLGLAVLRGARSTNVKAAVLTEGFFMDNTATISLQWPRREGEAIAAEIHEFLTSPTWPA